MDDKDLQIDDILQHHEKTHKKVDGKSKGDRTELHLCKLLSKHFNEEFSRALGSGSRWSQVGHLPEHAKKTLTGDICVPEGFLWVIESKGGYEDDVNFTNVCDGPITRLNEFIEQVKQGYFIDYDGYGCYVKDNKVTNIEILPSDIKYNAIRKEFNTIVWFNK